MLGDQAFGPNWPKVVKSGSNCPKQSKIIWMAQGGPKNSLPLHSELCYANYFLDTRYGTVIVTSIQYFNKPQWSCRHRLLPLVGQNKRQRQNVPRQEAIQQLSSVMDLQRQRQRERQKDIHKREDKYKDKMVSGIRLLSTWHL